MSDPDNCALAKDGTLKDANDILFFNSPSDKHHIGYKGSDDDTGSATSSGSDLPTAVPLLERALIVKGKRHSRKTEKVKRMEAEKSKGKGKGEGAEVHPFFKKGTSTKPTAVSKPVEKRGQTTKGSSGATKNSESKSSGATAPNDAKDPSSTKRKRIDSGPKNTTKKQIPAKRQKETHDSEDDGMGEEDGSDGSNEGDDDHDHDDDDDEEEVVEEVDPVAQYEAMRESIQKERRAPRKHSHRGQDERTGDLRTVYTAGTVVVDGEERKGYWCEVCRHLKKRDANAFFTGSVTTRRTHISRNWASHGETYIAKCQAKGITPHPRALAHSDKPSDECTEQQSIEGFLKPVPKWSREGLLDHLVEYIVTEDEPFSIVEKDSFRRLLKFQRPATKDSDLPRRTKAHDEVLEKAKVAEARLREHVKNIPSQISFTFDAWTSKSMDPYLAITGHYIDSTNGSDKWELKSELLGFTEIEGNHGGANIASVILRVIDRYDIRDKLGWGTGDNATANDRAMRVLQRSLDDPKGRRWLGRERRIRCMEHTVVLGASAFLQEISPSFPRNKRSTRKGTVTVEDVDDEEGDDEDDEEWLADWEALDDIPDDEEVDEPVDFTAGDVLGKALAMINQIRSSSQAKAYFATICMEEGLDPLELKKWVRTRWGSMYDLLKRLIKNKAAVNKFCLLADTCGKVPKLQGKNYADYIITEKEWVLLGLIGEVLEEPREAQASFSSETSPTVWRAIPTLECLQNRWETMARTPKFAPVRVAIEKGLEKLRKWYKTVNGNDVYFVCLALDPSIKLEYAKNNWDSESYHAGYMAFKKVFAKYYEATTDTTPALSTEPPDSPVRGYGSSWIRDRVRSHVETETCLLDPFQEFLNYINSPLAKKIKDPIRWWGEHQSDYPTLSRIARDYLAIQGSSVPSERAFSSGGLTGSLLRNRLNTDAFEALQILKCAYKNGLISASNEAAEGVPQEWTPNM